MSTQKKESYFASRILLGVFTVGRVGVGKLWGDIKMQTSAETTSIFIKVFEVLFQPLVITLICRLLP